MKNDLLTKLDTESGKVVTILSDFTPKCSQKMHCIKIFQIDLNIQLLPLS